ncbi:MAG TPA: glycosyltransferase [Candidatus Nanopelagicales bacterium]|nr:glycosyltransferase [Candidatus Nanopelagicales bacterium]
MASYDVSLVTSGHDVADARLHRLVAALTDAGLTVEVLGLGDPAAAPATASAVRARPRRGAAGRLADAVAGPWRAHGRVILVVDPDSVPSAWLHRLTGRRLVVDVHEDYAALLADRSWAHGVVGGIARAGTGLASSLARRADLTVVADAHVPPGDARQRLVLRNLPYGGYLPGPTNADAEPRALHVCDLRRSRGLFDMVEAVAAAPGWTLDLVGPVAAADAAELDRRLATADLAGRVRLHGRRPPHEAWALARGAWVGLSLLHDTPAFRDAVPTKVYEYLGCGLPVVATPLRRQAELVTSAGAGVVVADAAAAAAALTAYVADPALLAAHRDAARAWSGEDAAAYDAFVDAVRALVNR